MSAVFGHGDLPAHLTKVAFLWASNKQLTILWLLRTRPMCSPWLLLCLGLVDSREAIAVDSLEEVLRN